MSEDQTSISGVGGAATRRGLLVGAGAIGAGVVLAGCGGDQGDAGDSPAGRGAAGDGNSGAGAGGNDAAELAKTSDIPIGGGMIFAKQGVVVTQPTEGIFKGFSAVCTHQGCPVARIDGGTINCTCHDSRFSIEDGSVRGGPATKPLSAKEIKVDGETITLV